MMSYKSLQIEGRTGLSKYAIIIVLELLGLHVSNNILESCVRIMLLFNVVSFFHV